MGFFEPSVMGEGGSMSAPLIITLLLLLQMIMKFGTDIKLDVFYTMVTKQFVTITSLWRHNLFLAHA